MSDSVSWRLDVASMCWKCRRVPTNRPAGVVIATVAVVTVMYQARVLVCREHERFVQMSLRLLSIHLSMALARGVTSAAMGVVGSQAGPLRTLLFRLLDMNLPQTIQQVLSLLTRLFPRINTNDNWISVYQWNWLLSVVTDWLETTCRIFLAHAR